MLYKRLHLMYLCILFVSQYVISLFYDSNANTFESLIESGYDGCYCFEWLFYYNRVIFPGLNTFILVVWLYVLFMCPECFPNRVLYEFIPWYGFPFYIAIMSPYYALKINRFNSQYIDNLFHHSLFAQILYLTPSFILSLLILTNQSCHVSPSHCWSLLIALLLQLIYIFDLTYLRMKHIIKNITFFHDHFLAFSLSMELLIIAYTILVFGYVDWDNKLNVIDQALLYIFIAGWIITIPFSFPYFYKNYYYESIHPTNATVSKWSIFYRFTIMGYTTENIMNRLYAIIHVACHHTNSYDIMYSINCPSIPLLLGSDLNGNSDTTRIALINFASSKFGIVRHTQCEHRFLCLQYQTAFMKLSLKKKIDYICEIAPYSSPWFKPHFKLKFNPFWYFYVFARIIGGTFPIFSFFYIYLYVINGEKLQKYGIHHWFTDATNKYEHGVIVFGMAAYLIFAVIWLLCAVKIATCEYYYGFIRALLINDTTLFLGVEKFHKWMMKSFQIVTILEKYTVSHIAIDIVSYCD